MSPFSVLAIDIDGTLVNSQDELTPATREALARAARAGIPLLGEGQEDCGLLACGDCSILHPAA